MVSLMHVKSVNQNTNPSFQAVLKYDKALILDTLKSDRSLVKKDFKVVSDMLETIDSFAKMEEDSVIKLIPRADNGQVNLYCGVYDSTESFFEPVSARSARKIINDNDFRNKYLENIKSLVKNIAITRQEINKIAESISNSKNIKGFDAKKNLEGINFTMAFVKSLENGYNPSERIIKFINAIDKNANNNEINLEIKNLKSDKTRRNTPSVVVSTKVGEEVQEKRVLFPELFKKPLEDNFVFKNIE